MVTGLKFAALDDATWHDLYAAWLEYALLIFPGQHLNRDEQIAFAKRFGPLEFEMAPLSNVKADGTLVLDPDNDIPKVLKGNMGWHCDRTYMPAPAKGGGVQRPGGAELRGSNRMGRHASRLRCSPGGSSGESRQLGGAPFALLQPGEARTFPEEGKRL